MKTQGDNANRALSAGARGPAVNTEHGLAEKGDTQRDSLLRSHQQHVLKGGTP